LEAPINEVTKQVTFANNKYFYNYLRMILRSCLTY